MQALQNHRARPHLQQKDGGSRTRRAMTIVLPAPWKRCKPLVIRSPSSSLPCASFSFGAPASTGGFAPASLLAMAAQRRRSSSLLQRLTGGQMQGSGVSQGKLLCCPAGKGVSVACLCPDHRAVTSMNARVPAKS